VFQLSLGIASRENRTATEANGEMQKFAQAAQSKTVENFRKITETGAAQ
jgi:hypothetical protein